MCGIVGVAGDIFKKEKDAFENMFIFSQVRGPHSSGVGSVGKNKEEAIIAKTVGRPDNLIDYDKRYDKVVDFGKKFILGHNRYATMGGITKKNAHPFMFTHIMGCHNGTIPDVRLRSLKVDHTQYGTDSEAVLANLNEHSVKDTFKELMGAWAFVWYDTRDSSVNMIRNDARDLYYVYSKDRKTMFFGSESGIITAAMERNEIQRDKIFNVVPGKHFKWRIPEYNKMFETPRQEDIPFGVENWGYRGKNHGFFQEEVTRSPWERPGSSTPTTASPPNKDSGLTTLKGTTEESTDKGSNVLRLPASLDRRGPISPVNMGVVSGVAINAPIDDEAKDFRHASELRNFDGQGYFKKKAGNSEKRLYRGYRGSMMSAVEFEAATKEGCAWCDKTATWGKPVRFIEPKRHICLECNNDPQIVEMFGTK